METPSLQPTLDNIVDQITRKVLALVRIRAVTERYGQAKPTPSSTFDTMTKAFKKPKDRTEKAKKLREANTTLQTQKIQLAAIQDKMKSIKRV